MEDQLAKHIAAALAVATKMHADGSNVAGIVRDLRSAQAAAAARHRQVKAAAKAEAEAKAKAEAEAAAKKAEAFAE